MREEVEVYVEVLNDDIILPTYADEEDAGMDIRASEDVVIYPQQTVIIPTGLKVAIPKGYEIQVRARSGISYKTPLRVSNGIGTIDSNYRNELGIIMTNTSVSKNIAQDNKEVEFLIDRKGNAKGTYHIKKGDRVAQIVLKRVPKIVWKRTDDINSIEGNRGGGMGSSGVK